MTILNEYKVRNQDPIKEFLIKNLPAKIKAGETKENSNKKSYSTIYALNKLPFINYNSKKCISIMMFDIDYYNNLTAKEYFKDIDGLLDYIFEKIEMEPTFVLETNKGFHFGFGLKNHVFLSQSKAVRYLRDIKIELTKILGCDPIASNRLSGVWRNPLVHPSYFSDAYNYELDDFKSFLPKRNFSYMNTASKIDTNNITFNVGERNSKLFYCGLVYAKSFLELVENDIFEYLLRINDDRNVGLEKDEIRRIASSIYNNYWLKGKIYLKTSVNNGIMGFDKISGLSKKDYKVEVKRRQRESAIRTLEIRDKKKNIASLAKASRIKINKQCQLNEKKINDSISRLKKENKRINYSSVAKNSGLNRKTVTKYMKRLGY